MMGDAVGQPASGRLDVTVRVVGGAGAQLELIGASGRLAATPVRQSDETLCFALPVAGSPYVRAQLVESDGTVRALTNPIYLT
jgi:hypothetical protein